MSKKPEMTVHYLGDGIYLGFTDCEACGCHFSMPMRHGYRYRPLCSPCSDARGEPWKIRKDDAAVGDAREREAGA